MNWYIFFDKLHQAEPSRFGDWVFTLALVAGGCWQVWTSPPIPLPLIAFMKFAVSVYIGGLKTFPLHLCMEHYHGNQFPGQGSWALQFRDRGRLGSIDFKKSCHLLLVVFLASWPIFHHHQFLESSWRAQCPWVAVYINVWMTLVWSFGSFAFAPILEVDFWRLEKGGLCSLTFFRSEIHDDTC